MVQLETEVTQIKKIVREVNPIGSPKPAWLIEENLHRFYTQDMYHDGGWENQAKWIYILHSREDLNTKFAEILERRKRNGWVIDSDSEKYPQYRKLTARIGNTQLMLEYRWNEEQVIEQK